MKNLLWIALAGAVLIGGYFLITGKSPQELVEDGKSMGETAMDEAKEAVDATAEAASEAADAAGDAVNAAAETATHAPPRPMRRAATSASRSARA